MSWSGFLWLVEANIYFKWLQVPLENKNKVLGQWNSQVPFSKGPLSVVKCKVTQFDRVYALADHMKAKPAQQFPQKKCSLLIPPGSRQAVTNRVIIMPQTEYPDNSVSSRRSHSVPLSSLRVSLEFRKGTYSYYHCELNTWTYHLTPTVEYANGNTLHFIQNVPGKAVKVVREPGLSFLRVKKGTEYLDDGVS